MCRAHLRGSRPGSPLRYFTGREEDFTFSAMCSASLLALLKALLAALLNATGGRWWRAAAPAGRRPQLASGSLAVAGGNPWHAIGGAGSSRPQPAPGAARQLGRQPGGHHHQQGPRPKCEA